MPVDRYYIEKPLSSGVSLRLEGPEFHHMAHVARLSAGEEAELVDGKGALAVAKLETVQKKEALLNILNVERVPKPARELILAQALPRLNRLDNILEKATELGATQIWLFPGALSERKSLTEHQLERMQAITVAALKQCGRLWLPELHVKPGLDKWTKPDFDCFFGDVNPQAVPLSKMCAKQSSAGVLFVVGPESGLNNSEEEKLREMHFCGVKLNANILRTDTAAMLAVGLLSHFESD